MNEFDEQCPTKAEALRRLAEASRDAATGRETYAVRDAIELAAMRAGASVAECEQAAKDGRSKPMSENAPVRFARLVARAQKQGQTLQAAVAYLRHHQPELCAEVLETIGLWPSSEKDFAELQRQSE